MCIKEITALKDLNITELVRYLTMELNAMLVFSPFLAKNDRGIFGARVAPACAVRIIPLAFSGTFNIHVATFLCYIIRFASVPVTVAR